MGLESFLSGIPGIGTVAGFAASAFGDHREASMNRDFQDYQASRQMDFQASQADITRGREDTAHQREVADLSKAGLNPILSGTGGSGLGAGPTPMGAAAGGSLASLPDFGSSFATAMAAKNRASENPGIISDNRSKAAVATTNEAMASVADAIAKSTAATAKSNADAARLSAQLLSLKVPEATNNAQINDQIINPGIAALSSLASSAKDAGAGIGKFLFGLFGPPVNYIAGRQVPRSVPKPVYPGADKRSVGDFLMGKPIRH